MTRRWSDFVSGRSARIATIVLLTAQLGGCAVDLVSEQAVLISAFCTAAPGEDLLETIGAAVWLLLGFSRIVGLAAPRLASLRPVYWLLIVLIPVALAGQAWLLQRGTFFCDAP